MTEQVRGAYMQLERGLAASQATPDPIHATIEDTHACFDKAVGACKSAMSCGMGASWCPQHRVPPAQGAPSTEQKGSRIGEWAGLGDVF